MIVSRDCVLDRSPPVSDFPLFRSSLHLTPPGRFSSPPSGESRLVRRLWRHGMPRQRRPDRRRPSRFAPEVPSHPPVSDATPFRPSHLVVGSVSISCWVYRRNTDEDVTGLRSFIAPVLRDPGRYVGTVPVGA